MNRKRQESVWTELNRTGQLYLYDHYVNWKIFFTIFRSTNLFFTKKARIFFQPNMTIHIPIESTRNMLFLNFFLLISDQKNPENRVKIRIF
jgi:hypothetical protein